MPKRFHLKRPKLATAVTAALEACQDVQAHERLLAMRLAASGQFTAAQIAAQIGISRRQFFHWVNALKAGGVTRLLARTHGGGAAPQVAGKVLTELQAGLTAGQWKRAKVHVDYHIQVDKRLYSVPYGLIGKAVDVRIGEHLLEVYYS